MSSGCGHGTKPAGDTADAKPLPSVQVAAVTRGTLEKTLPATGTLQTLPGREAAVSPPVAGILSSLSVRYGQTVSRGQIIAQLSAQALSGQIQQASATVGQNQVQVQQAQANATQQAAQTQTSILQAQATLKNAEAALAGAQATLIGADATVHNAQENFGREQTLFAEGLVPQKDVEAAQLSLRTAAAQQAAQRQAVAGQRQTVAGQQAAVQAARAAGLQDVVKRQDVLIARQQLQNAEGALTTARSQRALYTLRAPLDGQVTSVGATVGETVDTATKIAVVADLRRLQLVVNVPSNAAASVHPGQSAAFSTGSLPGRVFHTSLQSIAPGVDTASGTVPALAVIANPSRLLRDDSTVRVQIVTARHTNVLIVPRGAVLSDPDTGRASVVTVSADGTAHVVPVTLGLSAGERVEITGGVRIGDQVAVTNHYGLPDGAKVQVTHDK